MTSTEHGVKDPLHLPMVLGGILLSVLTGMSIIPSYGWLWYLPIPGTFIIFSLILWKMREYKWYASPIVASFAAGSGASICAGGVILGGLVATQLSLANGMSVHLVGVVSIVGAVIGLIGTGAYLRFALPYVTDAKAGVTPSISPLGWKYVLLYFLIIVALSAASWALPFVLPV